MLSCSDIAAYFHKAKIFSGLGISAGPGSVLLLKGANGSGKSTLLKILAGLHDNYKGTITWYDNEPNILPPRQYIGHKMAVKMNLSVIDNIAFWCELNDKIELVRAAVTYFELHDIADTPCYKLSQGLLKRVALSRLLCDVTNIWLLDEPDSHLDYRAQLRLTNLINTRTSENGIVIMTSHHKLNLKNSVSLDLTDFRC
jgi:heme exporter protein A